jgi:hypothetical protein
VIEIGSAGIERLPESHRPPELAGPSPGEVVAWRPGQVIWRGSPVGMGQPVPQAILRSGRTGR